MDTLSSIGAPPKVTDYFVDFFHFHAVKCHDCSKEDKKRKPEIKSVDQQIKLLVWIHFLCTLNLQYYTVMLKKTISNKERICRTTPKYHNFCFYSIDYGRVFF